MDYQYTLLGLPCPCNIAIYLFWVALICSPQSSLAEEYYLKQRDRTDTIEANKVRIEIKSKADEIIGREKNNIDEFNSVNNFSTDYDNFLKTKLDENRENSISWGI